MEKTNTVKFTATSLPHYPLAVGYAEELIKETSIKFLGIRIDNHPNWKSHLDQIIRKLSAACSAVMRLFHILNIHILRIVYFAHVHSVIKYRIIFGEILLMQIGYLYYKKKRILQLWLVLDLEVHVAAYLPN
jgi:hypothetical protein